MDLGFLRLSSRRESHRTPVGGPGVATKVPKRGHFTPFKHPETGPVSTTPDGQDFSAPSHSSRPLPPPG